MQISFFHAGATLYGADKSLLVLVEGVVAAGHQARVYLPGPGPLVDHLAALPGVTVQLRPMPVLSRRYQHPWGLVCYGWELGRAIAWITAELRRTGPDLVHTNTIFLLPAAVAARLVGLPHVWHVLDIVVKSPPLGTWLARLTGRLSDRVIAVSEAVRRYLVAADPSQAPRIEVIRNGIDPKPLQGGDRAALRRELGLGPTDVLVGMLGRIHPMKGQDVFLEAIRRLPPRPGLHFTMVGGVYAGDEATFHALQDRAQDLPHVHVLDFRTQVADVYAALDVFVLPSALPDPLPTVVLEAMAAGLPVIATAHGGAPEMVQEGLTGFLVPPGDAAALADRILRLVEQPQQRASMGLRGQERQQSRFTPARFLAEFLACCEGVVRAHRLAPGRPRVAGEG